MKRVFGFLTAMLILCSLACPVFAAEFVPSISDKNHPEVVPTKDGDPAIIVDNKFTLVDAVEEKCIVITPVSQANTSTEIPQKAKEILLDVYDKLTKGTMELPYEKVDKDIDPEKMVIRDLFDISLLCQDHPAMLAQGHYLEIVLDLGVDKSTQVAGMVYEGDQWHPAIRVVNNGDGTITLTLDRVGAVALSVPTGSTKPPVQTGDNTNIALWIGLMAVSAAALAGVVIFRRKIAG